MNPSAEEERDKFLASAAGTFWELLGCRLTSLGPQRAVIELDAESRHLNHLGIVHGGVYATLLDQAMGAAAMTAKPGISVVTTNLNVHYTAPSRGGRLEATGIVVHMSRRLVTVEARVVDDQGTLCAWGSGTFRIIGTDSQA